MRWSRISLLFALPALLLVGCSADDSPLKPLPEASGSVEVGLVGGTVTTVDERGIGVAVTLPPLAVSDPVTVTITAEPAPAGMVARFRVEPADLVLSRSATVVMTIPDDVTVPENPFLHFTGGGSPSALPGAWDPVSRQLTVEVRRFGYADAAKTDAPAAWEFGDLDCILQLQVLQERIAYAQAWFGSDDFGNPASEPVDELRALATVLRVECGLDGEVAEAIGALEAATCQAFQAAKTDLDVFLPTTDAEVMQKRFLRLIHAEEGRQFVQADCGGSFPEALDQGTVRYLEALQDEVAAPGYADDLPWSQLWGRMRVMLMGVGGELATAGADSAEAILYEKLLPGHMAVLRQVALEACAETGEQMFLADLAVSGWLLNHPIEPDGFELPGWVGYESAEVARRLQSCGSRLAVSAYDGLNELLDEQVMAPSGEDTTVMATISVPSDGYLELHGPVRAFLCSASGATSTMDDEVLVIKVGDTIVAEREPVDAQYFQNVYDLSLAILLEDAGIPAEDGQTFLLELERRGTGCSEAYGEAVHTVFAVEVTLQLDCIAGGSDKSVHCDEPMFLDVDAPAGLAEDLIMPLVFRAGYVSEADGELGFAGMPYTITTDSGDILDPSGVTGEDGLVQTMVQALPGQDEVVLTVTVLGFFGDSIEETVVIPVGGPSGELVVSYSRCYAKALGGVRWGSADSDASYFSESYYTESFTGTATHASAGAASGTDADNRPGDSDASASATATILVDPMTGQLRGMEATTSAASSASNAEGSELRSVYSSASAPAQVHFTVVAGLFRYRATGNLGGGAPSSGESGGHAYYHRTHLGDRDASSHHFSYDNPSFNEDVVLGPGDYQISLGSISDSNPITEGVTSTSGSATATGGFTLEPLSAGAVVRLTPD